MTIFTHHVVGEGVAKWSAWSLGVPMSFTIATNRWDIQSILPVPQ